MAAPNAEEIALLGMFHHRISDVNSELDDYWRHDQTLLRFLRARDLNLDKAEDMFRKHLQWRVDNDIENILNIEIPNFIEETYPYQPSGFDNDGSLVGVIPFGKWDLRKTMDQGYRKDFVIFVKQIFEQILIFCKQKSTKEKCLTQINLIVDYQDFSLKQIASREVVGVIMEVLRMFEANYPETLKSCIVINAPSVFQVMYKLIKSLASAHTLSKIRIFGSNQDEWKAAILEHIDPDQIPAKYGGSNTTCSYYRLSYGFDVFPNYEIFPEEDMHSVKVLPGQKYTVGVRIAEQGTILAWNFLTEDFNIDFSVTINDNELVVELCRADSHKFTQKGQIHCEKAGIYTLIFDNSFSKFRAKNLKYTVAKRYPKEFIM